jgi:hypothetical protein
LNGSTPSILDDVAYFNIDSTVPHLWLPRSTCDKLESLFGLQYDNATDLYLVNSTIHQRLLDANPTFTFGLGNSDPTERVSISLPYGAFDLQASYPIYDNSTSYFPIRRAANESQYILGRTFLQEAYIVVDYERSNFSVHQALFPTTNAEPTIVPIVIPKDEALLGSKSKHLGGGAIAGIVIGVLAFIALLVTLGILLYRRRARNAILADEEARKNAVADSQMNLEEKGLAEVSSNEVHEMNMPEGEVDGIPRNELDSSFLQELPADTHWTKQKDNT